MRWQRRPASTSFACTTSSPSRERWRWSTPCAGCADPAELEQRAGIDIERDLVEEYEGMLAILVDEVEFFVADPTVAPILEDLAGWPVAVTSGVEERFTDRHFTVDGGLVLVVAPEPVTFEPGDFVLARGTAALFDREWVDEQVLAGLTEEDLDELDGRPLVIADHVEVLAGVDIRAE